MKNHSRILASSASLLLLVGCQSGYQTMKDAEQKKPTASAPVANKKIAEPSSTVIDADKVLVQSGDTLYGIAFKSGLNFRDIALWNSIDEPYTIKIGQQLRLTPPASFADNSSLKPTTPSLPNVKPVLPNTIVTKPIQTVSDKPIPAPAAPAVVSNVSWQWPSKGTLLTTFITNDKTHQGIKIAGTAGQDVLAAADGVVVYSGTGLVGYGELLIVKHNNEWISAYAHNSKRVVLEGAKVKAGQKIAEMGRTGATQDMLHFEIRKSGKPVDPLLYLPKP